ncbi:MAG: T9SS type A sorting domain-containing protein, partial [Ignavibacteria bacterium]
FNLSNEVNVGAPDNFSLRQNYPNPFNPSTKIEFALPKDGNVSLSVYDNSGKEVASLINETRAAGYYTVDFNAAGLASGVYFYKLDVRSGDQSFVKVLKMSLLK